MDSEKNNKNDNYNEISDDLIENMEYFTGEDEI